MYGWLRATLFSQITAPLEGADQAAAKDQKLQKTRWLYVFLVRLYISQLLYTLHTQVAMPLSLLQQCAPVGIFMNQVP